MPAMRYRSSVRGCIAKSFRKRATSAGVKCRNLPGCSDPRSRNPILHALELFHQPPEMFEHETNLILPPFD